MEGQDREEPGPLLKEEISEAEGKVGDCISLAVDDIETMVDVKEFIN